MPLQSEVIFLFIKYMANLEGKSKNIRNYRQFLLRG